MSECLKFVSHQATQGSINRCWYGQLDPNTYSFAVCCECRNSSHHTLQHYITPHHTQLTQSFACAFIPAHPRYYSHRLSFQPPQIWLAVIFYPFGFLLLKYKSDKPSRETDVVNVFANPNDPIVQAQAPTKLRSFSHMFTNSRFMRFSLSPFVRYAVHSIITLFSFAFMNMLS